MQIVKRVDQAHKDGMEAGFVQGFAVAWNLMANTPEVLGEVESVDEAGTYARELFNDFRHNIEHKKNAQG